MVTVLMVIISVKEIFNLYSFNMNSNDDSISQSDTISGSWIIVFYLMKISGYRTCS